MEHPSISFAVGIDRETAGQVGDLVDEMGPSGRLSTFDDHDRMVLLHHPEEVVGLLATLDDTLIGFAQLHQIGQRWELALATADNSDEPAIEAGELLPYAVDWVANHGGGHLVTWARHGHEMLCDPLESLGFTAERALLQLRAPLPLGEAADRARAVAASLALRSFKVGIDEGAWLVVNNAAFAGHPEQSGWDLGTISDRETESWFDPAGFIVLEESGSLVGSCWTKEHRQSDPPLGEIYVIAVDPRHHGQGLGKALAVAGLDHLAAKGISQGMLYVEGDNAAALHLYEQLGFTTHHTEHLYGLDVARG